MQQSKICSVCSLRQPLCNYSKKTPIRLSARCKSCDRVYQAAYRVKNREAILQKGKTRWWEDRDAQLERGRAYRRRNKKRCSIKYKIWYINNRELKAARGRKYVAENYEKVCAKSALQRARKLQRTPVWADLKQIARFYAECPEGYEVDHIIPLQGEFVSGLHVLNNLQYLPERENRSKGNRIDLEKLRA